MCTVTVVPTGQGCVRLVCNRDELRSRPEALPPTFQSCGPRRAVYPLDPASGGTWIGANDAGLVVTLLNVNPGRAIAGALSRGSIIPPLLTLDKLRDVAGALRRLDTSRYGPFRLIALSGAQGVEIAADGRATALDLTRPVMFCSSSLGDEVVERPRRELFEATVALGGSQDAFHDHHWPDRPHVSVRMSRPEARTVSRTVVERSPEGVGMRYAALDESGRETTVRSLFLPVKGRS